MNIFSFHVYGAVQPSLKNFSGTASTILTHLLFESVLTCSGDCAASRVPCCPCIYSSFVLNLPINNLRTVILNSLSYLIGNSAEQATDTPKFLRRKVPSLVLKFSSQRKPWDPRGVQKLRQGPNFPEGEERIVGGEGGRKTKERILLLICTVSTFSPHRVTWSKLELNRIIIIS